MLDLLLATLICLLVVRWLQMKPFYWRGAGISYSIPLPIFGSMLPAFYLPLKTVLMNLYKKVGDKPLYGFHHLGLPSLIVRDPKLVKKLTVGNADKFMERGYHTGPYDPVSKGIFFANGEEWKTFRNKMTPYFTPARIKEMVPLIEPVADDFTRCLGEEGEKGPVDVHSVAMKMTTDVVMTTIFGLKPDAFVNPDSFFVALQKELMSFAFALKILLGFLSPELYNFLKKTTLTKRANEKLAQFVNDAIDYKIKHGGSRPDFLEGMVKLMQKEKPGDRSNQDTNNSAQARFDRFSITGQCMALYVAGTETTGNTIAFLLYELALNQGIQQKARDEILSLIKRRNNQYDLEDLQSLRYVNMVIKETERKYPILPVFSRKCTESFEFEGVRIAKGTFIILPIYCIHHDPKYFPEPDKFIPERFAVDSNIPAGSFVPFGYGPRICIGMKLAETEILLVLSKLLPKYRVFVSTKTQIPIKFSLNPSLGPSNGVWLNVEEIS